MPTYESFAIDGARDIRNICVKRQSEEELIGHLCKTHLHPFDLIEDGIPRYEIEKAAALGYKLDEYARGCEERLSWTKERFITVYRKHVFDELENQGHTFWYDHYRLVLVKILKYLEMLQVAKVNWNLVNVNYPMALSITVNITADSKEVAFNDALQTFYRRETNKRLIAVAKEIFV